MNLIDRAYRSDSLRALAKRALPRVLPLLPKRSRERLLHALETVVFRNTDDVHALPPIFHYWSHAHLRPRLRPFGFEEPLGFYKTMIGAITAQGGERRALSIVSLGCGEASMELELIAQLRAEGIESSLLGIELTETLCERAAANATERGLGDSMRFIATDALGFSPDAKLDVVIAHQFLHHVEAIETLITRVARWLKPGGLLLSHDMIGRNGHQLWPEARARVEREWASLAEDKKRDRRGRIVDPFEDVDCAAYSLEGIAAERILPALLATMTPVFFFGYAGFINAFIDRRFGPNFDRSDPDDCAYLDRLAVEDWQALENAELAPTQMFGAFGIDRSAICHGNLSPMRAVRRVGM